LTAATQRRQIKAVDMRFYYSRRIIGGYIIVYAIRQHYYLLAAFPAYEFHALSVAESGIFRGRFIRRLSHLPGNFGKRAAFSVYLQA
jgi:hypothetical protein